MAWQVLSSLSGGNQPISIVDTQLKNLAQWSEVDCTASGTNVITLTPTLTGYTAPAYANFVSFRFAAANNSTASVTLKVGALAALNVYKSDGTTQIGSGDIVSGQAYRAIYNSALNSAAGGWYLENIGVTPSATAPTITGVVEFRTGSATITIPTNATKLKVTLVGGGGGGGGCVGQGATPQAGGAGSAAATVIKYLSSLSAGGTLALVIGAAGAGGSAGNNNGTSGGDTTLASGTQSITTLTAAKGVLGAGVNITGVGAITAGGVGTNGDFNLQGGSGMSFQAFGTTDLATGSGYQFSMGGSSTFGQGGRATGSMTGGAGTGYGAGGAGGTDAAGTNRAGGAGTAGCAIFEWYA